MKSNFISSLLIIELILVSAHVISSQPISPSPSPTPAPAPAPGPGPSSAPYVSSSGLQVGYYKGKCNSVVDVEAIVLAKTQQAFIKDPTLLPALLRLQFHDCFVYGCDASLLISGPTTEQAADPNGSVRGYDVIEAIKTAVEAECPGVVSCADITALATGFILQLGGGPTYAVETGRKDGLVSNKDDVDLPSPTMTIAESSAFFAARNFTLEEMVVLLGCHSVGVTHCKQVEDRVYKSGALYDPLMDSALRTVLTSRCPEGTNSVNTVFLNQDPKNNNTVDNSFYNQLNKNRGILALDQLLARDPLTTDIVDKFALDNAAFNAALAKAMIKLQAFKVLIGDAGNIRKVCSKLN
ncbi:peroxidase 57-like [Silene latifolia]|uniref:peroxidase 57-like n=1 Tax=Silene latifolia TaxID=37657 RepID=UPI003D77003E